MILWLLPALLLLSGSALAIEQIDLHLGSLKGPDWSSGELTLQWRLQTPSPGGTAPPGPSTGSDDSTAATLLLTQPRFPGLPGDIRQMELRCPGLLINATDIRCKSGRLRIDPAPTAQRWVAVSFHYQRQTGQLHLKLPSLRWKQSRIGVEFKAGKAGWRVSMQVHQLALGDVHRLSQRYHSFDWPSLNPEAVLSGTVRVSRRGSRPLQMHSSLRIRKLNFSDESGETACEAVSASLESTLRYTPATARNGVKYPGRARAAASAASAKGETELSIAQGQCYFDPLYLEAGKQPISFSTQWQYRNNTLSLDKLRLHDPGHLRAEGNLQARFRPGELAKLSGQLSWRLDDLQAAYQRYAQPFVAETAAEDLELAGKASGVIGLEASQLRSLALALDHVYIEDHGGRYALYDLSGKVDWDLAGPGEVRLKWQGGQALAFELGQSSLRLASEGSHFSLLEAVQLPVLDGKLVIEGASLKSSKNDLPDWSLNGYVTPISLQRLSSALDWPVLSGKLSGVIPTVSYSGGRLSVDGLLLARVFDGSVLIRNLAIERPFGHLPRLQADVEVKGLDLKTLTSTYEFGRIEGGLQGRIDHLVMEDWQPASFDASFSSPLDDPRPHKISQRAIDNLTTIGSGVSGLFANPFLALFDNFRYDRLGVACKLTLGRCQMSGVEDRDANAYYIVKGGGLPRIDVVGYQREVDWDTLIKRLRSVSLGAGPEIR